MLPRVLGGREGTMRGGRKVLEGFYAPAIFSAKMNSPRCCVR